MASQNLLDRVKVVSLQEPNVRTGSTVVGERIDTKGFRWATVIITTGAVIGADTYDMTESDTTGGTYTAIADSGAVAASFTLVVNTADVYRGEIDLMHSKRWISATHDDTALDEIAGIVILSNTKATGDLTAADTLFQILDRA